MRNSKIKAKLSRNEPVLVVQLHLTDPSIFELVSLMGFDGIWMDMEHHGYSVQTAQGLMRAARCGTADIVARPAKGEFMRMGRMLESGAHGIMYPRCDDAREAAEVVKWAKFPPVGSRGFDGGNPDMPYCAMPMDRYVEKANAETFVVIQLEERHALDVAGEIARVEGVDAIMLGPADFSIQSGIPGQFNHRIIREAEETLAAAAADAGKHWGRPARSVEEAGRLIEMGAKFIFFGADILMVKTGMEAIQSQFAPLGFKFDNRLPGE